MLSEQQQRIMGYFIEEAKDHLNTIEQGLVNLQSTITDSEMVHEVFRAAHSVKGGAAMLGLNSIQHTAHRLEDYFKVLKECPQVRVDQKLETLFLRVYDTLQDQIDHLQGPFGLTDDKAQEAMAIVEPVFTELNQHLIFLVNQAGGTPPEDVEFIPVPAQPAPILPHAPSSAVVEESALRFIFQNDVPARLREMLQLFKQVESAATRTQLQELCRTLAQAGEPFNLANWCVLLKTAQQAIGNTDNPYRTLAPIIIKDVKRAQELVLSGQLTEIFASEALLNLLPLESSTEEELALESDLVDFLGAISPEEQEPELPDLEEVAIGSQPSSLLLEVESAFEAESEAEENWFTEMPAADGESLPQNGHDAEFNFDLEFEQISSAVSHTDELDLSFIDRLDDEPLPSEIGERSGPAVGAAELNSLADLFEGELPELGMTWQEEEVIYLPMSNSVEFSPETSGDFFDLLDQDDADELALDEDQEDDLSGLLNAAALQANSQIDTTLPSPIRDGDPSHPVIVAATEELPPDFEQPDSASSDEMAMFFFADEQPNTKVASTTKQPDDESSGFQNLDELFAGVEVDELATDSSELLADAETEDGVPIFDAIKSSSDVSDVTDRPNPRLENVLVDWFESESDSSEPSLLFNRGAEELEPFSDFLLDESGSEISSATSAEEVANSPVGDFLIEVPEFSDTDSSTIELVPQNLEDTFENFNLEDDLKNDLKENLGNDPASELVTEDSLQGELSEQGELEPDALSALFAEEYLGEEYSGQTGDAMANSVSFPEIAISTDAEAAALDLDALLTEQFSDAESPEIELVTPLEGIGSFETGLEQIAETAELENGDEAGFDFDFSESEWDFTPESSSDALVDTSIGLSLDEVDELESESIDWQDLNIDLTNALNNEFSDSHGDLSEASTDELEAIELPLELETDAELNLNTNSAFDFDDIGFDLPCFEDNEPLAETEKVDSFTEYELDLQPVNLGGQHQL